MNTKETTAKKEEKLSELLAQAEGHPLMQKIRAERAAAILAARAEAAGKIEGLKKEQQEFLPPLRDAEEQARAALAEHDERRKTLQSNLASAALALCRERQRLEREVNRAESSLLETSPPEIDEAIQHFRDLHELLLRKTPHHDRAVGRTNVHTMTKEVFFRTNTPLIASAMRYSLAAISELEQMKLLPAPDMDRIESLKKGVPEISEMVETSGTKPLPQPCTNPRLLLPSDDQIAWELGKLKEKVRKVLGR